jgi:pilus assembly protein CpaE
MDLEPGRGLTDAIENPSRIDGLFIERALIRANDNLSILSAEAPINMPLLTDGSAFVHLEDEFRAVFEHSVIDLPRNMLVNFPHLLNNVNAVVVVTELTLAARAMRSASFPG